MKYGETVKTWAVELDGQEHNFRFEHQFWTGEKKFYVDEQLIKHVQGGLRESASFTDDVTHHIAGHVIRFRYRAVGRIYLYDLFIDDNKIKGEENRALRMPFWAIALIMIVFFGFAGIVIISGQQ